MAATTHTLRLPTDEATTDDWQEFGESLVEALGNLGVHGGDAFTIKAAVGEDDFGRFDELPGPRTQRGRILRLAAAKGFSGLTADEASFDLDIPSQSCRPRFVELRRGGWIHETDRRRVSDAGATLPVFVARSKALRELGVEP